MLVRLHRWIGLVIAGFLVITGLTGSMLAFHEPLDRWLNPDLMLVQPPPRGKALPIEALIAHIEAALPEAEPRYLPLQEAATSSVRLRVVPRSGTDHAFPYDEAFFDQYSGALLGTRAADATPFDRRSVMGFMFRLHQSLALPSGWGTAILGGVSLLWLFDSLFGFTLTLPLRAGAARRKSWVSRWAVAWRIKRAAGPTRRVLDLHRAGGLWLWGMLVIFAWSSVLLSLSPVYYAAMRGVVRFDDPRAALLSKPHSAVSMMVDWQQAIAIGRRAMPGIARAHGFKIEREGEILRNRRTNSYAYYVRSTLDIRDDGAATGVLIDAATGAVIAPLLPRHPEAAGNAINRWLYGLHMAQVFGFPYRIFVATFGLTVAMLSITGILVWRRKRSARFRK
ncbi:putative iron-regulated membrane protein [Sphingobium wenxiniae]|uniref:Putative iron-regulated membrane protein n=1 Tax=Sphingobium wenxiniae (strain DSM 21828 / CGMCC 1.7748 / JZ-1) TaxID=595605 RepID=A0A562K576_SPHWJ|nr:putative iron-regulated membrane protein [Burkholderia sp. Ch1-1]MBB6192813.1 putative iron-regulated membrane protein [Sphingobium wenxiniae]TWH90506.1 putative iron-regulated membrane protein [Sphingobium wenxiniae]